MDTATNPLGSFTYSYVGVTGRLQTVTYPNNQTANYSYYPNSGDKLLQTLQNKRPNATNLSRFDYVYDTEHMITQWTKQNDTATSQVLGLGYDGADQLISVSTRQGSVYTTTYHDYTYDLAGNRQEDAYQQLASGGETDRTGSFNSVNGLQSVTIHQVTEAGPIGPVDDVPAETQPTPTATTASGTRPVATMQMERGTPSNGTRPTGSPRLTTAGARTGQSSPTMA